MAPRPPKLATAEAAQVEYVTWDQFVEEATAGITPFRMVLPDDDEPTEFPCPTGAQMEALGAAQESMDDAAAFQALFGPSADRLLELTVALPFTVRARLIQRIMTHYGLQLGDLPES